MYAQALLLTTMWIAAPPPELSGPKLEKGLEVRWTGQFTEASFIPGVRTVRAYDVETRMLVFSVDENAADVALFTRVFLKPTGKSSELPAGAVRMELARVDRKGHVLTVPSPADPDNPNPKTQPWPPVQLQGLPYYEAGMFLEIPDGKVTTNKTWNQEETNRPPIVWKVGDVDSFRGQIGLKITGQQMTPGFGKTGVRQSEWRRQESLCIMPTLGYASRLERIIEKREPDMEDLSFRSVLTLEQQGKIVYSGRLLDERREEAISAAAHTAMLDRLLADASRVGPKGFEALVRRIDGYVTDHPGGDSVPYREATLAIRKRAISAAKGNLPPAPVATETPNTNITTTVNKGPLIIGKPIPDISVEMQTAEATTKLSKLKGQAVLLVYFQPSSNSASGAMRLAQTLYSKHRGKAVIMPLAIGEVGSWKNAYAIEGYTMPIYDGNAVYKTHGLDATPVFIIVDRDGNTRNVTRGWGAETAETVTKELERWLK